MKKDLRLYVLMRNDLQSMTPGRCMAQAAHAANALVHEFPKREDVKDWQRQTKQGFGTTIVLAASKDKIDEIFEQSELKDWIVKGWVTDPEYVIRVTLEVAELMRQNYDARFCNYTFNYTLADENTTAIERAEETCAFVFGLKEDLSPYLGELPLY